MTMAKTFFENPDFVNYVRLLGELHRLIQQGRDEGPEGEGIRDRMDAPGERLSPQEVAVVKGIAADFYSLAESRDLSHTDRPRGDQLVQAVYSAREAGRFLDALELARQSEDDLPPAQLAELRATIWQAANEPKIAQMFFEGAARLERQPLALKTKL